MVTESATQYSMETTWKSELIMVVPRDVAISMKRSGVTYASVGISALWFADSIYQFAAENFSN